MHSAGLELTKLTYARLEDNLNRHRGLRSYQYDTWPNVKRQGRAVVVEAEAAAAALAAASTSSRPRILADRSPC